MYQTILFELLEGVARLTLNRPDRLNSFTAEMHGEVADALGQVTVENGARVLLRVLRGAGPERPRGVARGCAGRSRCVGRALLQSADPPPRDARHAGDLRGERRRCRCGREHRVRL